jgi:hypothetical protein
LRTTKKVRKCGQPAPGTKPETAADDDPGADTSTPPIPQESAARKRSADASCIPQARRLQIGLSIRAAVASPPQNHVHPSPGSSSRSSNCGASVSRSRSTTSSPTAPAAVQGRFAAEILSPSPSPSPPSNAPSSGQDSSCPIAARFPASTAPTAPSLLPPSPLQIDFSRGKMNLQFVPSSLSPFMVCTRARFKVTSPLNISRTGGEAIDMLRIFLPQYWRVAGLLF